jgi:hypothetical protein
MRNIIIAIVLIAILAGLIFSYNYRKRKKQLNHKAPPSSSVQVQSSQ